MRIISTLIAAVVCLVSLGFTLKACYTYDKDIDSYINRAQVAADREDMTEILTTLKTNLEKHDVTTGNTALWWVTVDTDLGMNYRAVERLLERLEGIKTLPKSDTAYQVALDDIRGTIRELPNPGHGIVWMKNRLTIIFGIFLVWFIPLVFLIIPSQYEREAKLERNERRRQEQEKLNKAVAIAKRKEAEKKEAEKS